MAVGGAGVAVAVIVVGVVAVDTAEADDGALEEEARGSRDQQQ